jgi:hypothetical protein
MNKMDSILAQSVAAWNAFALESAVLIQKVLSLFWGFEASLFMAQAVFYGNLVVLVLWGLRHMLRTPKPVNRIEGKRRYAQS